MDRYHSKNVQ